MAAMPTTRYVKSDDVHVAYQVLGDGPLDLLFVPGFVSHMEAAWQNAETSAFFRRLASFCRLILFDKRGTGMSDRGSQIFTLEQRMHDVQAIFWTRLARNGPLCSACPRADRCLCCTRPPIRSAHPRWFCMAPTPSAAGLPTTPLGGKPSIGIASSRTSNAIGARHRE